MRRDPSSPANGRGASGLELFANVPPGGHLVVARPKSAVVDLPQSRVTAARLARVLARVVAVDGGPPTPERLSQVAAELAGVSGAGVMLLADGVPQGSLATTGRVSDRIEELQYTLGEGPSIDAHRTRTVIVEPDLAARSTPRWPAFTPKALDAGVRAIFAFPVRVGGALIGTLDLHRDQPGPLSDDQQADTLVMADVVARSVIVLQSEAPPGSIASALDTDIHIAAHQAAGMVSVQLDVSVADALVRLRAYAFRTDRSLADVADDVVARRLRLDGVDER